MVVSRFSPMSEITEILCVSNGHGEDQIAARICHDLVHLRPKNLAVTALPLVGVGHAYQNAKIAIASVITQKLPSGGFSRMDHTQLWRDVRGGLLGLTWHQMGWIWQWAQGRNSGRLILAVGDIVPLVMAWLPTWQGGCDYVFVATAKSEYLWSGMGKPLGGSIFYPWERSLMASRHCRMAFVRDQYTADYLNSSFNLSVHYLGNPMMDGLEVRGLDLGIPPQTWVVVLLPGSRTPEVYENWVNLIIGAQVILRKLGEPVTFLAAIAPDIDLAILTELLQQKGWLEVIEGKFTLNLGHLYLVTNGFADCLEQSHFGLAMAGTATEQLVGLGKPVITIAGKGPQFTRQFALDQARLLGQSVIMVDNPSQVSNAMGLLLDQPDYFQIAVTNGRERMGTKGAAQRIAKQILTIT